MAQATIQLLGDGSRRTAVQWVWGAELGTAVTFASPNRRTAAQNARMWAALTEISEQVAWHGQHLPPDDWKLLFLAELARVPARLVPALDGRGFVNLDTSSSALTSREFAALLDLIYKFAGEHGVTFRAG